MKQSYTMEEFNSARSVVGDALSALGNKDERVWLLTPALAARDFRQNIPTALLIQELLSRTSLVCRLVWLMKAIFRISSA